MVTPPLCTLVGVGPGVSLAVARRFAAEGYTLALVSRGAEKLVGIVDELRGAGARAHAFPADAGDPAALGSAFAAIHRVHGPTAVLVYNAAVLRPAEPSTLAPEQLVGEFQVNVGGALVSAQAVIPGMRAAGSGTILFTGGGLALSPIPRFASLALGKAALRSLTLSLAQELGPVGIHVATVTICGFVREGTPFDPAAIAEEFIGLHRQERGAWEHERMFRG